MEPKSENFRVRQFDVRFGGKSSVMLKLGAPMSSRSDFGRTLKFGLFRDVRMFDFWVINPSSSCSKFELCKFVLFDVM